MFHGRVQQFRFLLIGAEEILPGHLIVWFLPDCFFTHGDEVVNDAEVLA